MKDCFRASRRGLSTVVTGAIMLAAVAIMGTTLVAWSNSNLFAHIRTLDSSYSDNANKINEFLIVENVWFCKTSCPPTTPPAINVTLTNAGNIGINVTKITLVNSTKSIDYSIKNVAIKQITSYSWQTTYYWKSQVPINIYVTTARGSIFTTQVAPP